MNKPLFKEGTRLIREYQGKKYEVSIIDGAVTLRTHSGAFSIWGRNIAVYLKLQERYPQ
ncbi:MAG: hypothetical protein ACRCY4_10665 [Brevinema sp.]